MPVFLADSKGAGRTGALSSLTTRAGALFSGAILNQITSLVAVFNGANLPENLGLRHQSFRTFTFRS